MDNQPTRVGVRRTRGRGGGRQGRGGKKEEEGGSEIEGAVGQRTTDRGITYRVRGQGKGQIGPKMERTELDADSRYQQDSKQSIKKVMDYKENGMQKTNQEVNSSKNKRRPGTSEAGITRKKTGILGKAPQRMKERKAIISSRGRGMGMSRIRRQSRGVLQRDEHDTKKQEVWNQELGTQLSAIGRRGARSLSSQLHRTGARGSGWTLPTYFHGRFGLMRTRGFPSHVNRRGRGRGWINETKSDYIQQDTAFQSNFHHPNPCLNLSVIPTLQDIYQNDRTALRANKQKGKYEDLNHYLEVQYRLLREDFIHPLRTGILSHLDIKNGKVPRNTKLTDVAIYENVHILGAVCTHKGLAYRLRFDTTRTRAWKWEHSKHLIYGSLVTLSQDDFETMHICTVVDRNVPDLVNGMVEVQVEHDAAEFDSFGPDVTFTMVEPNAYFESYRHVLTALRNIGPDFPFQKYIVSCDGAIETPGYLKRTKKLHFDFSPLVEGQKNSDLSTMSKRNSHANDRFSNGMQHLRNVPLLQLDKWPSASQLKLDKSQYSSLQHCLTKEFAIVQGPPGTGKTFLGLKVVQLLLHNWNEWNRNSCYEDHKPILIVCYTNHALDQFLEGIIKFTDKIVRVGSRSQSELLMSYSLKNLRAIMRKEKRVPSILKSMFRDLLSNMEDHQKKIDKASCIIEKCNHHIMKFNVLREFMDANHQRQLTKYHGDGIDPIFAWLLEEVLKVEQPGEDDNHSIPESEVSAPETRIHESSSEEDLRLLDEDVERNELAMAMAENREKLQQEVSQQYFIEEIPQTNQGNDDDFQTQKRNNSQKQVAMALKDLMKAQWHIIPMTTEESNHITDICSMNMYDRQRLYKYWRENYRKKIHQDVQPHKDNYQQMSQQLKSATQQLDKAIMENATVVGMTTTGAARYHHVLQGVQPKIIIVEEAAEVLEAHVVTALNKNCEHFILIGDHQQLRPNPAVYELAKDYNLDLSLFERMVNNDIPIKTLSLQHRMRPIISKLMKPFYKDLRDDKSVQQYPEVKGIQHSLYLISHKGMEDHHEESKKNKFEAEYLQRLCKYLLQQDYLPSQITVLTPYSGQLLQLKSIFGKSCMGVQVTVVDNFQGEENDIIILSLVRSNKAGKLGFLKIKNRVCVALSRAKIGLYVIGNFDFLANHSEIWSNIKAIAEEEGVISSALPLVCQQHPETKITASLPKDFDRAPEGGCTLPCDVLLACNHVCPLACHSYNRNHENIKCPKPCTKYLCKDHVCPKVCWKPCGPCMVKVKKITERCNHKNWMPCSRDPATWCCSKPCEKVLKCGHLCTGLCGSCPREDRHEISEEKDEIKCYDDATTLSCTILSQSKQPEHRASHQGLFHKRCTSEGQQLLICGHVCKEFCCKACPPCKEQCQTQCFHRKCDKHCREPCTPCEEPCLWSCQHHKCSKLCSEPCDRPMCNEPCPEMLQCGHPCIGLCGEECPELCWVCDKELVTKIFFGNEDSPTARFVILDCKHIVEVEGMDKWMGTKKESQHEIGLKKCPKCSTVIRKTQRYKSEINAVLSDIEQIKVKKAKRLTEVMRLMELFEKLQQDGQVEFLSTLLQCLEKTLSKPTNEKDITPDTRFIRILQKPLLSKGEIASLENLLMFAVKLKEVGDRIQAEMTHDVKKAIVHFCLSLHIALQKELLWITSECCFVGQQHLTDFSQELEKLFFGTNLCRIKRQLEIGIQDHIQTRAEMFDSLERIDRLEKILQSNKHFDEQQRKECKEHLQEIKKCFPHKRCSITEEKKIQIVHALQLKQGHWFKCSEGHICGTVECGGAMANNRCPECRAVVRDGDHCSETDNWMVFLE